MGTACCAVRRVYMCPGELEPKATLADKAMRMSEIIAVAAGGAGLAAYYKART